MPPLTASWADSQRARHPIGPWSLVADSNCRPAHYECAALPAELTKHGRMFYTGYHPAIRAANPFFQYHSAATPTDSVLYPLRCFPVSFATDTGTLEYSQAQHLFAYSFIGCPLAFGQRTTSGPCSPNLMSWRTVTATMEQVAGIEPAFSPWRGEVLAVIRYLHRIAGEPSLSPAMMLVLEVVNPEHHLYTL